MDEEYRVHSRAVSTQNNQSFFEMIGGEGPLRAIIDEFVDRVFQDPMIGFFFRNVTQERIKKFEYQHAAEFLGEGTRYQGRPLRVAHAVHPIRGGHFERRKEILRQVLVAHGVAQEVITAWLEHIESLRSQITSDPGSECRDESVTT